MRGEFLEMVDDLPHWMVPPVCGCPEVVFLTIPYHSRVVGVNGIFGIFGRFLAAEGRGEEGAPRRSRRTRRCFRVQRRCARMNTKRHEEEGHCGGHRADGEGRFACYRARGGADGENAFGRGCGR